MTHKRARLHAIVFDLDGTLVDSTSEIYSAICAVLDSRGAPSLDYQDVLPMIGHPPETFFTGRLDSHEVRGAVVDFRRHLELNVGTSCQVFDGTIEVLDTCRELGIRVAVATNKSDRLANVVLSHLGIISFFEAVVGTDGVPPKPAPDGVLHAMRLMSADRGVMVGDTALDIEAGRAAGLVTVGMSHGPSRGEGLQSADYAFSGMPDLRNWLKRTGATW